MLAAVSTLGLSAVPPEKVIISEILLRLIDWESVPSVSVRFPLKFTSPSVRVRVFTLRSPLTVRVPDDLFTVISW